MTPATSKQTQPTQAIDWFFTLLGTPPPQEQQPPPAPVPMEQKPSEPETPPAIQSADDLQAANEWLKRERARLQEYTETQLARIQREHQALVSQTYFNEQTMILNCQELSRKEELLARQSRALQQQAAELSQREQALAAQLEQWMQIQREVGDLSQVRVQTEQEAEQQRTLLEALRQEIAALQRSRESMHGELEAMAREMEQQREARAREQDRLRANQAQIEQRLRNLDRAEQAVQRRLVELDELEARLRLEFEEQERQLAEQRRAVAAVYAKLRQRPVDAGGEVQQQGT
jgi:chromosome segregation ATPase